MVTLSGSLLLSAMGRDRVALRVADCVPCLDNTMGGSG